MEKQRKRKRESLDEESVTEYHTTSKRSEFPEIKGRHYSVSIALPGSIISNAQTLELKTYLAGQLARAAAVFNIDEIVIFDEMGTAGEIQKSSRSFDPNLFLCKILQYLETPQYLRKSLFPMQPDLKYVGLLNPLDAPHHMRMDEDVLYREGVVLDQPIKTSGKGGSYVNCGMRKNVQVDKKLKPGVRVTVEMTKSKKSSVKHFRGNVVSPTTPRIKSGLYWGYNVRMAQNFSSIFTGSSYKGGYDLTIGTSERGQSVDTLRCLPSFRHLLIVFGGLNGLEYSLENDESLHVEDVSLLFHHYINTCPSQGSRTIRTEEAILISLSSLRPLIEKAD